MILRPFAVWLVLQFFTLPEPIFKAALITAAAPPVTACAAIAIFLGIDAAMVVVITITTMLLVPLSLPPVVLYLVDLKINAGLWKISLRLALFIVLAFFVAALIKKLMGQSRVHRNAASMDGISVIFIGIFIIGVMHGVTATFLQQPWYVFQILLVSTLLVLDFIYNWQRCFLAARTTCSDGNRACQRKLQYGFDVFNLDGPGVTGATYFFCHWSDSDVLPPLIVGTIY